jgi:hypothetical protein
MQEVPKFIQGVFAFKGAGLRELVPLVPEASYKVAYDKRAQTIYLRAGNTSDHLICLVLSRAGEIMRYFPIGARNAIHVPLAITEDLEPETEISLRIGAPAGASGEVVIDLGLVEI